MEDWQQLGLNEPSTDMAVIKRAYAARLRVTRPDDDAVAYQALREAYDRLMAEVKQTPAASPRAPTFEIARPAALETIEPRTSSDNSAVPPGPSAAELCVRMCDACQQGEFTLLTTLALMRQQLQELPLTEQAEASSLFADLVLRTPRMPTTALQLLDDHFGWLDDFRTERLLGTERARALQDALQYLPRPITDPQVLEHHAPVLALNALLEKRLWLLALLFTTLSGVSLQRLFQSTEVLLQHRLGLNAFRQRQIATLLTQAQWVRRSAAVLLLFAASLPFTRDITGAAWATAALAAIAYVFPFVLRLMIVLLNAVRRPALQLFKPAWRRQILPGLGVGLLVLAGGCWEAATQFELPALRICGAVAALIGAVLALPEIVELAMTATALLLLLLVAWHPINTALLGLAAAWVFGGVQLHLYKPFFDQSRPIIVVAIGLPAYVAAITEHAGVGVVLTALMMSLGLHQTGLFQSAWWIVASVGLSLTLLLSAQKFALQLADRLATRYAS